MTKIYYTPMAVKQAPVSDESPAVPPTEKTLDKVTAAEVLENSANSLQHGCARLAKFLSSDKKTAMLEPPVENKVGERHESLSARMEHHLTMAGYDAVYKETIRRGMLEFYEEKIEELELEIEELHQQNLVSISMRSTLYRKALADQLYSTVAQVQRDSRWTGDHRRKG